MVLDGLKAYVQLAAGLTDVTRERATAAARALVSQGEAGVDALVPDAMRTQVGTIAEDLLATGKANRDLLVGLVRAEVERSVARLGLVSAAELDAATRRAQTLDDRVDELERDLRTARSRSSGRRTAKKSSTRTRTAKTSTAKKSTTKKSTTKKSTTKKSTAKKSTAKTSTAKKSTTKKAAKKSTAKSGTAKKSTTKRTAARKSTARKSTTSASGS